MNENISNLKKEIEKLADTLYHEDFEAESNSAPSVLYHYTDLNALTGIIENKKLWATHTKYLNDRSEMIYAFDEIIFPIMKNNNIFKKYHEKKDCVKELGLYLTSFSEKGDDLAQWRGYGKKYDSVCIGFNIKKNVFCSLNKIEYNKEKQEEYIRNYLSKVNQILSKYPDINPDLELYSNLLFIPFCLAAKTKRDSWKAEAEWRLIYPHKYHDKRMNELLEFRTNGSKLIPYISVNPFKNPNLFEKEGVFEIVLPQSDNFKNNKTAIEKLLDKNSFDFEKIKIKESKIPIAYSHFP
jgi:hypothetical protein